MILLLRRIQLITRPLSSCLSGWWCGSSAAPSNGCAVSELILFRLMIEYAHYDLLLGGLLIEEDGDDGEDIFSED